MKVVPVRFTNDAPAMRRFLEVLGLSTTIASDSGGWTELAGAGGGVGLHTADATEAPHQPGETSLSFEAEEPLEDLQRRLLAAGFEATIIDESFGRSLRTVDPDGLDIQVNEAMQDEHGYHRPA